MITMNRQAGPMTDSLDPFAVANAHWVTDRLAVGGDLDVLDDQLAARQGRELVESGVTHVLDVRFEADDHWFWDGVPEVSYRHAGIDDAGQRVAGDWFEGVVDWVMSALEDPAARVLTHCHMGINRGPSVGFAVLLAQGRDPVGAIDTIRTARPVAHVWYAEDALRWHHERTGAGHQQRLDDQRRLARWREEHPLDVTRIIAQRRSEGQ